MGDVADILGAGKKKSTVTTAKDVIDAAKSSAKGRTSSKGRRSRPKHISREVFNLLGSGDLPSLVRHYRANIEYLCVYMHSTAMIGSRSSQTRSF